MGVGVGVRVGVAVGVAVRVGVGDAVGVGVVDWVGVGVGVGAAVCETASAMFPEAPPKPPTWIQ